MWRQMLWAGIVIAALSGLLFERHLANTPSMAGPSMQFVTVEKDVELQVVDWGGSGRPLVFLAGLGLTSRSAFDNFAPKFTNGYHVYGITRRGFGSSSKPASGYSADRLGDDVLAVIDALKLDRPVLIGHSIAGQELSSVATRHPKKVAGLVYLDAAYDYAYYDPTLKEVELRIDPSAPVAIKGILAGRQRYTNIRVPVLAIYAIPHDERWRFEKDPAGLAKAEADDIAEYTPQAKAFEKGVPSARVVILPRASHGVYKSNETEVFREMSAFLGRLP